MARSSGQVYLDVIAQTGPAEREIARLQRIVDRASTVRIKDGASVPLGRISGKVTEFDKSLEASNARVIAFGASAGIIYGVQRAFSALVKTTIDVEKKLNDIRVILNTNEGQFSTFGNRLFTIANKTGQSFDTAADAALELARQGLGLEATLKRTEAALSLTRISGLEVEKSVNAITAAMNSFNRSAVTDIELVSKLANVDTRFAVSATDLADALSRVGSTAQAAGVGIDELLGIVTAAQQITARGGAVIGNALKSIFTRLGRSSTIDQLQALGVEIDNSLTGIEKLQRLSDALQKVDIGQANKIKELAGGVYQINIVSAALEDLGKQYSLTSLATNIAAESTDEAITRVQELNKTLSALINETVNNLSKVGAKIGEIALAPGLNTLLKDINNTINTIFPEKSEGENFGSFFAEAFFTGIGKFFTGPGLLIAGTILSKLTIQLAKFVSQSLYKITTTTREMVLQGEVASRVNQVLQSQPGIMQGIRNKTLSIADAERLVVDQIQQGNLALSSRLGVMNQISKSMVAGGFRLQNLNVANQEYPTLIQQVRPSTATGTNPRTPRTRAAGHIPSPQETIAESVGAYAGGYKPGKIKTTTIPRIGRVVYNSAEQIKTFDGLDQPAIIPPKQSKAGRVYRQDFLDSLGFDPYENKSGGYVPNFMPRIRRSQIADILKTKRFKSITYQKKSGETADYHAAQYRVRSDLLVGAPPPKGYKSWTDFDEATNTLVLRSVKGNKDEPVFRRFSLGGIKQIRTDGETFDVYNKGFVPNFLPINILKAYRQTLKKIKNQDWDTKNIELLKNQGAQNLETLGTYQPDIQKITINPNLFDRRGSEAHTLTHEAIHHLLNLERNISFSQNLKKDFGLSNYTPSIKQKLKSVYKNIPSQTKQHYTKLGYADNTIGEEMIADADFLFNSSVRSKRHNKGQIVDYSPEPSLAAPFELNNKNIKSLRQMYKRLLGTSLSALNERFPNQGYANEGLVPNFVPPTGTRLGSGMFGHFHHLRKFKDLEIGKKIFRASGNMLTKDVKEEYTTSKLLELNAPAIQKNFPYIQPVKTIGSLNRAYQRGYMGKETVVGRTLGDLENYLENNDIDSMIMRDIGRNVKQGLEDSIGIDASNSDLHGQNIMGNTIMMDYLKRLTTHDKLQKSLNDAYHPKGNRPNRSTRLHRILTAISKRGGKLYPIDTGFIRFKDRYDVKPLAPRFDFTGKYGPGYNEGLVPNFSMLGNAMMLKRGLQGISGIVSPKKLIGLSTGRVSPEELVPDLIEFMKKPSEIFKSMEDLDAGSSVLNFMLRNKTVREKFARFGSKKISEGDFDVSDALKNDTSYIKINDYAKYRLFGGTELTPDDYFQQVLKDQGQFKRVMVGVGINTHTVNPNVLLNKPLLKNRDGSYRFNSSNPITSSILNDISDTLSYRSSSGENRYYNPNTRRILGEEFTLGKFIGTHNRAKTKAIYEDRWDVDLHEGELDLLKKIIGKPVDKNESLFSLAQNVGVEYGSTSGPGTYSQNLDSLMLRYLVSKLPADPLRYKGVVNLTKKNDSDLINKGLIPNFAKIRIPKNLNNKTITERMAATFDKGKDYKDFYSIVNSAFSDPNDAYVYANIASALSPMVPDYVAGKAAVKAYQYFKKTGSTNVEDYINLPIDVGNYKYLRQLGHLDKGSRKIALSKALNGQPLGSHNTDKTRHYADALSGDADSFPIDTNVIQTILGKRKKGAFVRSDSRRVIKLARQLSSNLGIEPRQLQAGIFKGNSKYADRYNVGFAESIRDSLSSGLTNQGLIPNFNLMKGYPSIGKSLKKDGLGQYEYKHKLGKVLLGDLDTELPAVDFIKSFERGKGHSQTIYKDLFELLKGKGFSGVRGFLLNQNLPPRSKSPIDKLTAQFPQLMRGQLGSRNILDLATGDDFFELAGGDKFKNQLAKRASFILNAQRKAGVEDIDFTTFFNKGMVPNFANPIQDAISREVGAGVSPNKVRVSRHPRLVSQQNKRGFGIYNTDDEPGGLIQGINNVAALGLNPQKYKGGMADGLVPNYVMVQTRDPRTGRLSYSVPTRPSEPKLRNLNYVDPENIPQDLLSFDTNAFGITTSTPPSKETILQLNAKIKEAAEKVATFGDGWVRTKEFKQIEKDLLSMDNNFGSSAEATKYLKETLRDNIKIQRRNNSTLLKHEENVKQYQTEVEDVVKRSGGLISGFGKKTNYQADRLSEVDPVVGSRIQQMRSERQQRLTGFGIQASFLVPMLTSAFSQAIGDDTKTKRQVSGVTDIVGSAASTAVLGAGFGPVGIGVGAAIGGAIGFAQSFSKLTTELPELTKQREKASQKLESFNNSVTQYVQSLEKYQTSLNDFSGAVKPGDIQKFRSELFGKLLDIPSEFRNKIISASTSMDDFKEVIVEIGNELGKQDKIKGVAEQLRANFEKVAGGILDTTIFDTQRPTELRDTENVLSKSLSTINSKELFENESAIRSSLSNFGSQLNANSPTLTKDLNRFLIELNTLASLPQEVSEQILAYGQNNTDARTVGNLLFKTLSQILDTNVVTKTFEALQTRVRDINKRYVRIISDLNKNIDSLNLSINNAVQSDLRKDMNRGRDVRTRENFDVERALTELRGVGKISELFGTNTSKLNVDTNIRRTEINADQLKAVQSVTLDSRSKFLDIFAQEFKTSTDVISRIYTDISRGKSESGEQAEQRAIASEDLEKLVKIFDRIQKTSGDDVRQGIANINQSDLASAGFTNAEIPGILTKINVIAENTNDSIRQILENAQQQRDLLEIQTKLEAQQIDIQKRINQYGGTQAFIDDSGIEALRGLITDRIALNFNSTPKREGIFSAKVIDSLTNTFGVLGESMSPELMNRAIEGRTQSILEQVNVAELLSSASGNFTKDDANLFEKLRADAPETAELQIKALAKFDQVPQELAAVNAKLEIANSKIDTYLTSYEQTNTQAFTTAIASAGLNSVKGLLEKILQQETQVNVLEKERKIEENTAKIELIGNTDSKQINDEIGKTLKFLIDQIYQQEKSGPLSTQLSALEDAYTNNRRMSSTGNFDRGLIQEDIKTVNQFLSEQKILKANNRVNNPVFIPSARPSINITDTEKRQLENARRDLSLDFKSPVIDNFEKVSVRLPANEAETAKLSLEITRLKEGIKKLQETGLTILDDPNDQGKPQGRLTNIIPANLAARWSLNNSQNSVSRPFGPSQPLSQAATIIPPSANTPVQVEQEKDLTKATEEIKKSKLSQLDIESGIIKKKQEVKSFLLIEHNGLIKQNTGSVRTLIEEYNKLNAQKFKDQLADAQTQQLLLTNSTAAFSEELENATLQTNELKARLGELAPKDLGTQFLNSLDYSQATLLRDINRGAADLANGMKDSFKGAFKEFTDGSKSAEDAFRSFAIGVGQKMLDLSSDIAINSLFSGLGNIGGNLFGRKSNAGSIGAGLFNKGGKVKRFSKGGLVTGGSGTKDDVQAMMTPGEFVINKASVETLGPDFLEKLNKQEIKTTETRKFSEGAYTSLINDVYTTGKDPIKQPEDYKLIFDHNLSNFALTNEESPANNRRFQKESELINYIKGRNEYEEQKKKALREFKRGQNQRLIGAAISAAISIGASYLPASKGQSAVSDSGNSIGSDYKDFGMSYDLKRNKGGIIPRYANGGYHTDTVPALLTGGEYVINRNAVRKYGSNFFEGLNQIGRYAEGGPVGAPNRLPIGRDNNNQFSEYINVLNDAANSLTNAVSILRGSLDSGNANNGVGGNNNYVNIEINIDESGKVSSNVDTQVPAAASTQNTEKEKRDDAVADRRALAEIIQFEVVKIINKEQRNGGLLAKNR